MKRKCALIILFMFLFSLFTGCGGSEEIPTSQTTTVHVPAVTVGESSPTDANVVGTTNSTEIKNAESKVLKIGYLTDGLGDNSVNDAFFRGAQRFMEETGIELTVLEQRELQDYEMNARTLCQEDYDLLFFPFRKVGEIMIELAKEYPNTYFYVQDTEANLPNLTSYKFLSDDSAFLTGAFSVLMNQELGGKPQSAFIGGQRNPTLERAQYSYTAGSEYAGGNCTVVYVGSFTDLAKGKEVALQLYQEGHRFIQAYAGGTGTGVFQAAESMPEGYYALGEADGQFNLSDRIIASMVTKSGDTTYGILKSFYDGTLEPGYKQLGYADGITSIVYAPGKEDLIPTYVKDRIDELGKKIISGEIKCPTTEEEYKSFAEKHLGR